MGACNSSHKQNSTKNDAMMITISQKLQGSLILPLKAKSSYTKHHINNLENSYIIMKINEVNGEQILIENCINSTFIILDYSSQVLIEKCYNCKFLIAPCKSLVIL